MEYYIYNHTLNEIDYSFKFKTVNEPIINKVFAGRCCENCGTIALGKWEFPSYNIPFYEEGYDFERKSYDFGKKTILNKSENRWNDVWYQYFMHNEIWDNDKIVESSTAGTEVFYDVREDLKIASKIPDFIRQYKKEFISFLKFEECPICGTKYPTKEDYRKKYYPTSGLNTYIKDVAYCKINTFCHVNETEEISIEYEIPIEYKKLIDDACSERAEEKFDNFIKKNESVPIEPVDEVELTDAKTLKKYLNDIINIEKEIYLVTNRLKELYYIDTQKGNDAFASKMISSMDLKNQLEELKNEYESKVNKKPQIKIKNIPFDVEKPKKPNLPTKPEAPILQKPGLFNKKKITAENELLMKNFEKAMSDYETLYSEYEELSIKYKVELEAYYKKEEEFKKEQEENRRLEIKRLEELYKKESEDLKTEYDKLLAQYENSINSSDAIITKESVIAKSIHNEVVLAEELLENLYKARKKAYAYGVIFEKYRDLVPVSMFYEYLSSGRCSELEGANGAYNLYESELRANIIISKLTEINEHLEDIKQNQFMIYNAISDVTYQLSSLNSSMDTMIKSLNSIDSHLTDIEENTELIAHNTEVTAFYAKKNTELTNALGYMIAFK